ncbi:hypothetical protein D5R40_34055 [Okeania hirsuta]|uniref:Uncharacterized protein n=1 Tax=Okeania hirsuta TaxID=1458930 RepID=A0A3N6NIC4_9CYAN|nr:hypothetical protein D4Z78_30850 [Okeania hirsuta]RQH15529.1 hypothetical protein D5R40_34055 [Okeania hirsuta]
MRLKFAPLAPQKLGKKRVNLLSLSPPILGDLGGLEFCKFFPIQLTLFHHFFLLFIQANFCLFIRLFCSFCQFKNWWF